MSSVRENLIAAKALITDPKKWGREEYHDTLTGCMCAYGAIGGALGSINWWNVEHSPEALALEAALPPGDWLSNVARYNDAPDTDHADIMALFDRAISSLPLHEGSGE